jgi:thioesterase domain-containing protein
MALFRVAGGARWGSTEGWDACARSGFAMHHVPGDHLSMFLEPHVDVLAAKLATELDRAESVPSSEFRLAVGRE